MSWSENSSGIRPLKHSPRKFAAQTSTLARLSRSLRPMPIPIGTANKTDEANSAARTFALDLPATNQPLWITVKSALLRCGRPATISKALRLGEAGTRDINGETELSPP